MSRRSRPHYRPGLEWILGVAFPYTLTRPVRLAQGLPFVRCCGSSRASSPHGLTAPGPASHDGDDCVQLPLARGCYHLAPRRTFTSNPVPMPGTHAEAFGLGVMHVDEENKILSFLEKPANPPPMPGKPDAALCSMGIYVFETKFLIEEIKRDAADPNSSHDFGKDVIPNVVAKGQAVAHHF